MRKQTLFILVVCAGARLVAMELHEIRQLCTDEHSAIGTAHLVYTEENRDARLGLEKPGNENTTRISGDTKNKISEIEKFLDFPNQQTKKCHRIYNSQGQLIEERVTLNQSGKVMSLLYPESTEQKHQLLLHALPDTSPRSIESLFDSMYIGLIPQTLLSENENTSIDIDESRNAKTFILQITRTQENFQGDEIVYNGIIECDLEQACRYRSIRWKKNGKLTTEVLADDFRIVGDRPFPFKYMTRRYDENENLITENTLRFEKVEFNPKLPPEAFKIEIPAGTRLMDAVMSMNVQEITGEGYMNISDVLNLKAHQIASEAVKELDKVDLALPDENLFIPDVNQVIQNPHLPFILDIQGNSIKAVKFEKDIKQKEFRRFLEEVSVGNIAWDGSLIALKGTQLINLLESPQNMSTLTTDEKLKVYRLPDQPTLPYPILLITDRGDRYYFSVEHIMESGIEVDFRPFNEQDVLRYKDKLPGERK